MINGNMVGASMLTPKSLVLEDDNGNSFVGVIVGEETVLTATDNDVREGSVYAGDAGVSTGTKVIPSYHTYQGFKGVPTNSKITITIPSSLNLYDYTQLQTIMCSFNTSLSKSVYAEKVSIDNHVYNVQSVEALSTIVKDDDTKTIDFGITNDSGSIMVIRYFMYKEII